MTKQTYYKNMNDTKLERCISLIKELHIRTTDEYYYFKIDNAPPFTKVSKSDLGVTITEENSIGFKKDHVTLDVAAENIFYQYYAQYPSLDIETYWRLKVLRNMLDG